MSSGQNPRSVNTKTFGACLILELITDYDKFMIYSLSKHMGHYCGILKRFEPVTNCDLKDLYSSGVILTQDLMVLLRNLLINLFDSSNERSTSFFVIPDSMTKGYLSEI